MSSKTLELLVGAQKGGKTLPFMLHRNHWSQLKSQSVVKPSLKAPENKSGQLMSVCNSEKKMKKGATLGPLTNSRTRLKKTKPTTA